MEWPSAPPPTPRPPDCILSEEIKPGFGIEVDVVAPPQGTTESKTNDRIPLIVTASDIDELRQTCQCLDGESPPSSQTIWIMDSVNYKWSVVAATGQAGGKLLSTNGPATLYQPPELDVGETHAVTIKVEITESRGNDKPASVTFKITLKRLEDCKYSREVSIQEEEDKSKPSVATPRASRCWPLAPKWDPTPKLSGEPGPALKVCAGERVILRASGGDSDTLKLLCASNTCGAAKKDKELIDEMKYIWTAVRGSFPDHGGGAVTNSKSTTAIYKAPDKAGEDTVTVIIQDSGQQAPDGPIKREIPIKIHKVDLGIEKVSEEDEECKGGHVCVNRDDDDNNKKPDFSDTTVSGENDLVKITLKKEPAEGRVTLDAPSGKERIRVWTKPTKQTKVDLPVTFLASELPEELWVEGVKPSEKLRDVELVLKSDNPPCEDRVRFTVVSADLILHKPPVIDTGQAAIDEAEELRTGVQTFVNLDNDDEDSKYDTGTTDTDIAGEDEMVKAILRLEPKDLPQGTAKLEAPEGPGDIKAWKAANKGTEYNLGTALAVPGDFTAVGNALVKELWIEGISPHTAQRATKLKLTYKGGDIECQDAAALTLLGIERIEWVGRNNSSNHDNTLTADTNWPGGLSPGALRVFPDARVAAGAVEGAPRDRVDVKATLTVAPVEPVNLYFKSFDVDDPTSATAPVDDDTAAANDEDNRGTAPARSGAFIGEVGGILEQAFDAKDETFQFRVTLRAGDNFRVVGNGDEDFLGCLENRESELPANNADKQRITNVHITGTPAQKEIREADHYASNRVLTVWRFLHVERDSYALPGGGEVFDGAGVGNDDVAPGNLGNADIARAVTEYRPAYVEMVDDLGALDVQDEIAFVHNLADANAAATGNGVRDVNSLERFWVVHVVSAYEGETTEDADPDDQAACSGYSPASCMIYTETIRDVCANWPGSVARAEFERRTVLHETIHRVCSTAGVDLHTTGGVMDARTSRTGTNAQTQLNDAQRDYVRDSDRPRP